MSKLFAFRLLGVPWLEHVSNVNNLITTSIATRSRPDLIGINTRNEFLIFEAKGRTNGFSRATQNKAKEQTKVINTICGRLPVLRVAVQSYFNNQLEVYVEDPDEIEKVPIDIEFTKEHYFNSYYSLFLELKELDYRALNYVGVEVSFSKQLDEVIKSRNFSMIEPESEKAEFDKEGFKCFPDGLKIRLDPSVWPINA